MSDNSSDYPTALDPAPVELEDNVDPVPYDAIVFAINQAVAIQTEIGTDPVDFTATGGLDFGTLAALLRMLGRMAVGTHTCTDTKGGFRVTFPSASRFTAPPFVILQQVLATEPTQRDHFYPKRITTDGFTLGTGHILRSVAAGSVVYWLAVQAPFGIERAPDADQVE